MTEKEPLDKTLILKRFAWMQPCFKGLNLLLGDIFTNIRIDETGDPLSRIVRISLSEPVPTKSRGAVRIYIREYSKDGDCVIPRLNIEKTEIVLEILLQYRHHGGYVRPAKAKAKTV